MSDAHYKVALDSKTKLDRSKKFGRPVTTEIRKDVKFYMAEDYHQQYVDKHNGLVACPVPNLKP